MKEQSRDGVQIISKKEETEGLAIHKRVVADQNPG